MSPRLVVVLTALTAAALYSWYLARTNEGDDADRLQLETEHFGYYLSSARILGTGPDGSLLYEIEAVRAEQQSDDRIEFSDVRIDYTPESDVPWTIFADTATIFPNEHRVLLAGHVRAVSDEGFSGDETEIRTPVLEFDPQAYVAQTDARVQIRIGSRSLTATGMLASLNENRLELQSNVSGRFIP